MRIALTDDYPGLVPQSPRVHYGDAVEAISAFMDGAPTNLVNGPA